MLKKLQQLFWVKKIEILLIFFGSFWTLILILPSGIDYGNGISFWGVHSHDTLWHIALARSFSEMPLSNPLFSGVLLGNYHYITNLILFSIKFITGLSWLNVTFRVYPILISILLGILTVKVTESIFNKKATTYWSLFFLYFGSNMGFLIPFFKKNSLYPETAFWVQQQNSMFNNLPLATSFVIILAIIFFLDYFLKTRKIKYFLATSVLIGILPLVKAHALMLLPSFGIVAILRLIIKKKIDLIILGFLSFVVLYFTFLPNLDEHSGLIFEPGYFIRSMMSAKDRLDWQDWVLRMQHYESLNSIHYQVVFWLIGVAIFFVANIHTRLFSIISIYKYLKKFDEIHWMLILTLVFSAILPMLFLTKGVAWNSIQFFYISLFLIGFYAADGVRHSFKILLTKRSQIIGAIILILLTIPTGIITIYKMYESNPIVIDNNNINLIEFLNNYSKNRKNILMIPVTSNSVYISALTNHHTYLGSDTMAQVTGINYQERYEKAEKSINNEQLMNEFIRNENIDLVISNKDLGYSEYFEIMYSNKYSYVYQKK